MFCSLLDLFNYSAFWLLYMTGICSDQITKKTKNSPGSNPFTFRVMQSSMTLQHIYRNKTE